MNRPLSLTEIELIIFDVDGTLLDMKHRLDKRTKAAVKRCQQNHMRVSLATGKNWDSADDLVKELEIDQPMIFSNGAIIRDNQGNLLDRTALPLNVLQCASDYCQKEKYDLAMFYNKDAYVKQITYNVELLYDFGAKRVMEIGDWDAIQDKMSQIHKLMVLERERPQDLYQVEKDWRPHLADSVEYCQSLPAMFEVMPKGVSKGSALAKVCSLLDIDISSVLAFGDGNNDIGMLNAAGWGVTLANASPQAKASADILVPSIDRCGTAQFLEYLLDL